MKRLCLTVLLALLLASPPAEAATCNITEHSASGILTAERLNQRIRQTEACLNGRVGNTNWAAGEPLALANLQNRYAIYSQCFTILDEDDDATAGEDIAAENDMRLWRVPVTSTVMGMTVRLASCSGCSANITLQVNGVTTKTFAGVNSTGIRADYALNTAVSNAEDLTIDVAGTLTGVKQIDVCVFEKAEHSQ